MKKFLAVLLMLAMLLCGAAWVSTANALTVTAQLALPNWVRARGMSIFQMSIMGAMAIGAAFWGLMAGLAFHALDRLKARPRP